MDYIVCKCIPLGSLLNTFVYVIAEIIFAGAVYNGITLSKLTFERVAHVDIFKYGLTYVHQMLTLLVFFSLVLALAHFVFSLMAVGRFAAKNVLQTIGRTGCIILMLFNVVVQTFYIFVICILSAILVVFLTLRTSCYFEYDNSHSGCLDVAPFLTSAGALIGNSTIQVEALPSKKFNGTLLQYYYNKTDRKRFAKTNFTYNEPRKMSMDPAVNLAVSSTMDPFFVMNDTMVCNIQDINRLCVYLVPAVVKAFLVAICMTFIIILCLGNYMLIEFSNLFQLINNR